MIILISLSSRLISEALCDLFKKEMDSYQILVDNDKNAVDNSKPDIILVDQNTINQKLFSRYPEAKVILIDTGLNYKDIIATLLSYRTYGVLSVYTDQRLVKKALKVVSEGEIWLDNKILKAFFHNAGIISKTGKLNGLTERERSIIKLVCQGNRNKEIAFSLSMSEQTVKAHLNRIFRKFNVSNRSQLVALTLNNLIN
ncbi:MAG: response regulator transcription factor [Nitrospira sp.]|nr:response regulator transcription factor [Nitrospira sp.]